MKIARFTLIFPLIIFFECGSASTLKRLNKREGDNIIVGLKVTVSTPTVVGNIKQINAISLKNIETGKVFIIGKDEEKADAGLLSDFFVAANVPQGKYAISIIHVTVGLDGIKTFIISFPEENSSTVVLNGKISYLGTFNLVLDSTTSPWTFGLVNSERLMVSSGLLRKPSEQTLIAIPPNDKSIQNSEREDFRRVMDAYLKENNPGQW